MSDIDERIEKWREENKDLCYSCCRERWVHGDDDPPCNFLSNPAIAIIDELKRKGQETTPVRDRIVVLEAEIRKLKRERDELLAEVEKLEDRLSNTEEILSRNLE